LYFYKILKYLQDCINKKEKETPSPPTPKKRKKEKKKKETQTFFIGRWNKKVFKSW